MVVAMSWSSALILKEGEQVVHSWEGDFEKVQSVVTTKKGFLGPKHEIEQAKKTYGGVLILTNQRLMWFAKHGALRKSYHAIFELSLEALRGISLGGLVSKFVSISSTEGTFIFHLKGVGKKEIEAFKDMIMRQAERVRGGGSVTKEVVTREVVMIPCKYCNGLMPQTSIFCPTCGAQRKT